MSLHHDGVAHDIDDWRRLAAHVVSRREELDLTQEDVRARGGPSTATMRLIEGALQTAYRSPILRRLERALNWEPGSVNRILAGGSPTPTPDTQQPQPAPDELAFDISIIEASPLGRREKDLLIVEVRELRERQAKDRISQVQTWIRIAGTRTAT